MVYSYLHFLIQSLITLGLWGNQIGDQGTQHLADALQHNTVIHTLSSSISHLYSHFLIQTLTALILASNSIGDEGAQHLANALQNNTVTYILF